MVSRQLFAEYHEKPQTVGNNTQMTSSFNIVDINIHVTCDKKVKLLGVDINFTSLTLQYSYNINMQKQ